MMVIDRLDGLILWLMLGSGHGYAMLNDTWADVRSWSWICQVG